MLHIFSTIIVALLTLTGCYDRHKEPPFESKPLQANCNIAQLRELCSEGIYHIEVDMVCVGRVTANDKGGNFYRTMFIEDATGGAEIKLGTYNINAQYPIGSVVAIRLKGLAVILDSKVVQVGLPPRDYDISLREFESQVVIDKYIIRANYTEAVEPLRCNISDLDYSLCGRLVEIRDAYYAPHAEEEERSVIEGYHQFSDYDDNYIFTYVSPYSNFAKLAIPTKVGPICGILCHESVGLSIGNKFVIKPRFEDDI